jgi:glutamyl-tRNA synthetase
VNNTFKQINVFKAFNENVPTYGHVPMILGEDGKRLSKRHGALGVGEYSSQGILPEALKNYLLRLGWAKGDQEIFDHQAMEEIFLDGTLNQSPATFSMDKLLWFNKHYLDSMSDEQLTNKISIKEFDGSEYSNNVLMAIRDRCSTLNDFVVYSSYFFNDPEIFEDTLIKKHCKEETHGYLLTFKSYLSKLETWDQISIKETIEKTIAELDVGFGKIGLPLRLALTATVNSPSIDLVCEILGKDIVLKRLENFLTMIQSQEKDL